MVLAITLANCSSEQNPQTEESSEKKPVFELLAIENHGITFRNDIKEDVGMNYMIYDGIYQGAGLAIGDLNNDGLDDILFTGNQKGNELYLNKGSLTFENVTAGSGIIDDGSWSMGAAMADINGDGYRDIYICEFIWDDPEKRINKLYINQGDMTFVESAKELGVADGGYSIQSAFIDFDLDGDLDLYVVNQPPNSKESKRKLKGMVDYQYSDNFYINEGGTFRKATEEVGVKNYAYGLSATVADLNADGWPDIYVACDYEEPDLVYMNNGDGTFTNKAHEWLRHMSNYSMGTDIADINNDGWLDIYTADMVAEDNKRLKTNMSGMNPEKFWGLANAGYHYQYMFNALQLNNGNGLFSEIGQLAGVQATDWSWSPLLADFDNDGYKDLIVTNGQKRDVRNNDYNINRRKYVEEILAEKKAQGIDNHAFNPLDLLAMAPSVKLKNYAYRNNGDLTFSKVMDGWGMNQASWSHGSAFSDLDNDGDLDLIMNNHDDNVFVYRNLSSDSESANYVRFKFDENDASCFGAKVQITAGGMTQTSHLHPVRGYLSQSERAIHFGIGGNKKIESATVTWPDGKVQKLTDVSVNETHVLNSKDASTAASTPEAKTIFKFSETMELLKHQESEYNDFATEILLPHKMSTLGPCLATADVNNDGADDIFLGGAKGQPAMLVISNENGYSKSSASAFKASSSSEDVGAAFFDADGDEDLDLYVASGSNESDLGGSAYQDRLYLNDGSGNFSLSAGLPEATVSSGCVIPFDFDADNDLDLFVGGRQNPGRYPFPTDSRILQNNDGKFEDVTKNVAPELLGIGMITDAKPTDLNGDGKLDLVLVGEWMPLTAMVQKDGVFESVELTTSANTGWWNTVELADVDNDGDMDLLTGNLGLNIKYKASKEEPFSVFCHDFDNNGSLDIVLSYYDQGSCFPVRGRECSSQQMPFIKKKFPTYDQFGEATVKDIHGENLDKALQYHATEFRSGAWINNGLGKFDFMAFPNEAQIAPIQGIIAKDLNKDGNLDLICAGNYYNREVETTRSDAGIGCVLLGDGTGKFTAMHPTEHGLKLYKDVRDISLCKMKSGISLIAACNNDALEVYTIEL